MAQAPKDIFRNRRRFVTSSGPGITFMATSQAIQWVVTGSGSLLLSLGRTGNPYIVRRQYLRILGRRPDIDGLQRVLLFLLRLENQVILIAKILLHPVQVRLDADRLCRTERKALSTRLIRNLGQSGQTHLPVPVTARGPTHAHRVNGENDDV